MYIIGIDGGGTKTVGILTTETGERIAQMEAGPSNYHVVGEARTKAVLETLISGLFERAGCAASDSQQEWCAKRQAGAAFPLTYAKICLGMAGLGRNADRYIINSICDELGIGENRILTHDAHIALIGGTEKQEGIIVISGTGSIVYGINAHAQEARAGGWGYLLGDEGSGYDIGLKGLQAVARAADGRTYATELTNRLLNKLGLNAPTELIPRVHAAKREEIARLAEEVFRAAEAGDRAAKQLVTTAAQELAHATAVVIKRLAFTEPFEIVLSGGNLLHEPLFVHVLRSRIERFTSTAAVILPKHEPAYGAVLLARHG